MQKIWAIYKKELGTYFNSPIAYIIIVSMLLITSILFFYFFFVSNEASLRLLFVIFPWVMILFAPAISMRLLAEEKGRGTFELLATMPVRDIDIVLGKYLAAITILAITLVLTFFYPITVSMLGDLQWGPVLGGYLGLFMLGAAFIAIGLMASSWTRNQIIAMIIALLICLFLKLISMFMHSLPSPLVRIFDYISVDSHMTGLARGVIDLRDFIYYGSLIGFCLLATKVSLTRRMWQA